MKNFIKRETMMLIKANQELNAKSDVLEYMHSIIHESSDIYHLVGKLTIMKEKAIDTIEKVADTESNEYFYYRGLISYIDIIILTICERERE